MTKFTNYLSENMTATPDDIRETLTANCLPFIKSLKRCPSYPQMLYSGRTENKVIIKNKVRQDRRPKDTPIEIHKAFDNRLHKEFGIKARSQCIFTTVNLSLADFYGISYAVFPVGRFEVIWSPQIPDLYGDILDFLNRPENSHMLSSDLRYDLSLEKELKYLDGYLMDELVNFIENKFPMKKIYKKGDLCQALNYDNEVMIHCKEWVGIKDNHIWIDQKLVPFADAMKLIIKDI